MTGIVSLSFVDNLRFIASEISVKEVAKTLDKVSKLVLKWGTKNVVTYDTAKTKLVLFSRAWQRRRNQQLQEIIVVVRGEKIKFNKDATWWLRIWLNSQLIFAAHVNKRLVKAKTIEIQIRHLNSSYRLALGLVRWIQIAAAQLIALYGAEL